MTAEPAEMAEMFDGIAPTYDLLNSVLSAGNDRRWRAEAIDALDPAAGDRILDLGCGTGELLLEIHEGTPDAELLGVDVALQMLARAQDKAADADVPLKLVRGDATDLPLPEASVDGAISAFTLRNVPSLAGFFDEAHRVLQPDGRLVTLEIHLPDDGAFAAIYRPYFLHVLPAIGELASGRTGAYRYLADSVAEFGDPERVASVARKAGFDVDVTPLTFGTAAILTCRC